MKYVNPISDSLRRAPEGWERRVFAFEMQAQNVRIQGLPSNVFTTDAARTRELVDLPARVVSAQTFFDAAQYFKDRNLSGDAAFCMTEFLERSQQREFSAIDLQMAYEIIEAALADENTSEFENHRRDWELLTAELLSEEAKYSGTPSRKKGLYEKARALYEQHEHFVEASESAFNMAYWALAELQVKEARGAVNQMNSHVRKALELEDAKDHRRQEELASIERGHHKLLSDQAYDQSRRTFFDEKNRSSVTKVLDFWIDELRAFLPGQEEEVFLTIAIDAQSIMTEAEDAVNAGRFLITTSTPSLSRNFGNIKGFVASIADVAWFGSEIYARAGTPERGFDALVRLQSCCIDAAYLPDVINRQPVLDAAIFTGNKVRELAGEYAKRWGIDPPGIG